MMVVVWGDRISCVKTSGRWRMARWTSESKVLNLKNTWILLEVLHWEAKEPELIMWRDKTQTRETEGEHKKRLALPCLQPQHLSRGLSLRPFLPLSHCLSFFNLPFVPLSPLRPHSLAVKHGRLWPLHNTLFSGSCPRERLADRCVSSK